MGRCDRRVAHVGGGVVTRHTVESVGLMAIEQVATLRDALVMAEEREREMVAARAIQAAEIERLREIERCARRVYEFALCDEWHADLREDLRAALGAK